MGLDTALNNNKSQVQLSSAEKQTTLKYSGFLNSYNFFFFNLSFCSKIYNLPRAQREELDSAPHDTLWRLEGELGAGGPGPGLFSVMSP